MRNDLHTRAWQKIRLQVLERDRWTCMYPGCGKPLHPGRGATVDHIVPHSRGGSAELSNLRAMCWYHNSSMGAKQKRGYRRHLPRARTSRF